MSILHRTSKSTSDRTRAVRALSRAIRKAPTPASREELQTLMTRL